MKRTIDWPNHLVSFVLIVLSILMAFQLEKCSSDRKEDKLVEAHLTDIVEETRYNVTNVNNLIDKMEGDKLELDTLLRLMTTSEDVENINRLIFQLLDAGGLYLKETAYKSFVESGDIRFVDDFERKKQIVRLYEYYELANLYSDLITKTYNEGFFGHISEKLDLYGATPQPLAAYTERPFVNAVSSYRYFTISSLRTFGRCRDYMEEFIEKNEKVKH